MQRAHRVVVYAKRRERWAIGQIEIEIEPMPFEH